jgi:hypothetical protein
MEKKFKRSFTQDKLFSACQIETEPKRFEVSVPCATPRRILNHSRSKFVDVQTLRNKYPTRKVIVIGSRTLNFLSAVRIIKINATQMFGFKSTAKTKNKEDLI